MKLMYEGANVAQWRCELNKEAPEMFSVQGMNRVVARDPVAMAEFFDLTLRLFLRHVVGVSSDLHADAVASACGVGGNPPENGKWEWGGNMYVLYIPLVMIHFLRQCLLSTCTR